MELQLAKLRPHQVESAKRLHALLRDGVNCVDESDTGIGKTYVAAAVANALQKPTLVIVPKIAVGLWERAAEHFGDKFSVIGYEKLRTGRTPFGWWDNTPPSGFRSPVVYQCQSCLLPVDFDKFQPCHCHPLGIHCVETKKVPWKYGHWNWSGKIGLAIFDEVHRCSGRDSLNADMLIACKRQKVPVLGLSATLASSPLEMRALGFVLGLHRLAGDGGFYPWLAQNGCGKLFGVPGWRWTVGQDRQIEVMDRIRKRIVPACGVRVRVADVAGFPEREITSELYDLDETPETIDQLYSEMSEALRDLENRRSQDKSPDHPLTKILRASQKIELLKVPVAAELAKDFLDTGYSVALFVNYTATILGLSRLLKCDCIIDGSVTGERRERAVESFQQNQARKIILNSRAGGICINLHDTHGGFPRAGLVMPAPSATIMRQVFGRLQRDGGKSKCLYRIILANRTVEVSTHRNLQKKLNNLDALNGEDFLPDSLGLTKRALSPILAGH